MRKFLLIGLAALSTLAVPGSLPAQAQTCQFPGTVNKVAAAQLTQYPLGGSDLARAIARVVEANPKTAYDVVHLSASANPAQKKAIGAGLAEALRHFASCGTEICRKGAIIIREAIGCADPDTRTAFMTAEPAGVFIPTGGGASASSGGQHAPCVSRSRPDC